MSANSVRLSKHAAYRLEEGYVLFCHCKYLQDFRLPSSLLDFLDALKQGVEPDYVDNLGGPEAKLYRDLGKLNLLDFGVSEEQGVDRDLAAGVWGRMAYDENEFST